MGLLVLIPLSGYILLWRRVAKSRSSSAALHASSALLVFLYLAALGGQLLAATVLLLASGTLILVYELVALVRRNTLLPTPLGVFLFLCALFALLHHDASYYFYDEYSHWGVFLSEMLAKDALWDSESSALVLRYPPGAPLWQYFFLRFTDATEGNAYLAQFSLLMLPLLVMWQGVKWRQLYWLLSIFALVALALSNFGHGFASLYVDHLLGAWFAGTIFNFLLDLEDRTPRQLLLYLLPVATLVLLKDAGLFFAAAAIGIMALLVFWRTTFITGKRQIWNGLARALTLTIFCVVCSGLITISWNENRDAEGIPQSTYSTRGILSGVATGENEFGDDANAELSRRFWRVVTHQQISKNELFTTYNEFQYGDMSVFTDRFRLTTSSLILLFVLWQLIVLYRLVDSEERWRWVIGAAGFALTAVAYLGILFLSYRFAFDTRGIGLPSYIRYAHSALLPLVLFVFLPLLPGFTQEDEKLICLPNGNEVSRSAALFALILGALFVFETPYLTPLYESREAPPVRVQFEPFTEKLRDLVGEDRLWIYLPVPKLDGVVGQILKYQMLPVKTEVVLDTEFFIKDPNALQSVIRNWDYLWFPVKDPRTDEILQSLSGEDLKNYLFHVDRQDDEVNVVALDGVFH